ncbi:hypothetical protein L1275_003244 [Flavobacterium sp. HSC-61S13]|nr:hypothetical protein [Flavobacterium sp. HSC-61S13]
MIIANQNHLKNVVKEIVAINYRALEFGFCVAILKYAEKQDAM